MYNSLFQYYQVSAGQVRSAAEDTRSKGDAVHTLVGQVEQEHQGAVQAVEGALNYTVISAPEHAREAAEDVARKTVWASCQLEDFADAIDVFNTGSTEPPSIQGLNTLYYQGTVNNFGVSAVDYPDNATEQQRSQADTRHSNDVSGARAALIADLQAKWRQLDANLDAAATRVAGNLQREPTDAEIEAAWKAGNLPLSAMLLWPSLNLSVHDIPGGLPADLAQMTNEELADYLLAHPDTDPNIMLNLNNTRPGVVDLMGEKLAQQIRDAEVNWNTDPEDLAELENLLQTWQDSSLAVTAALYESLGARDGLELLAAASSNFQGDGNGAAAVSLAAVFRRGLGLADAMWSDEEAAQYGRDLGQAIEDNRRDYPPVVGMEGALGYLLEDQYYSDDLLNPLGDKLVELDFGPRAWEVATSNLPHESDLMSSLFSAFANNDDAGKYFFGQDGRVDQYFDRGDDADPSYYNNLGNALETATTENPDQTAADIVADIVDFVGSKDNNQENFSDHDLMNPELRDDMAGIMKTWIGDVHNSMIPGQPFEGPGTDGDWDPVTPGVQEYGVNFDQRELAYFLGDIGKDDAAHDIVVSAEHTYSAAAYDHYMSDPDLSPEQRALQADRVANPTGSVLGALDFGAATQEHETTQQNDQAHNDRVDSAFAVADALVGLVPTDKVPLAGDLVDGLMGAFQDSLQQDTSGVGNYEAGTVYDGGQNSAEAIAQAAYYRTTPDSELPVVLQGHPPVSQWTPDQQAAYVDWLDDTGMSPAASNSVTNNAGNSYTDGYTDAQNLIQGG